MSRDFAFYKIVTQRHKVLSSLNASRKQNLYDKKKLMYSKPQNTTQ